MFPLHPVFYILLLFAAFFIGIYFGLFVVYYFILFAIHSFHTATNNKYFDPEFISELKELRKNLKLRNFFKFMR